MIKASEIEKTGTKVTTVSPMGGIGYGYKLNGTVYQNGGNGFYYDRPDYKAIADGGKAYIAVVRGAMKHAEVIALAN